MSFVQANLKTFDEMRQVAEDFRKPLKLVAEEYKNGNENAKELGKTTQAITKFIEEVEKHMILSNEQMAS